MFRLEHVQEYTRALEESSDEEEDEEDDMPMTIKRPGEDSDKLSVNINGGDRECLYSTASKQGQLV